MIELSDVYMVYEGGVEALRGVSLRIQPGRVNVLLGPNGSGKSTMLKLIMGVYRPTRGRVRVYGIDPSERPVDVRRMIGYVPEDDVIYHSLRVGEYLSLIARIYGVPREEVEERVRKFTSAFLLDDKFDEFIGSLSHGLRRRVLLAAALIHDPRILLLDEPFIGLDPRIAKAVKTVLREKAREGRLVLVTTHVLEIAEVIADNVIVLYRGEVVAEGPVSSVIEAMKARGLEEAFLRLIKADVEVMDIVKALVS